MKTTLFTAQRIIYKKKIFFVDSRKSIFFYFFFSPVFKLKKTQ